MSSIQIHSKKMRLRILAQQWNRATSKTQAEHILLQIKALLKQLQGWVQRKEIYQILGAAALALGLSGNLQAQQFAPVVRNPFGFTAEPDVYNTIPNFMDWDNDGDLDMLSTDYYGNSTFYENVGSATLPQFAAGKTNAFGFNRTSDAIGAITTGDLDGDGDIDILMGKNYYEPISYYENIGTPEKPNFTTPTTNPFGINTGIFANTPYTFLELADIDADGDLDLMIGQFYNAPVFLENIGTAENPRFGSSVQEPFGLSERPINFDLIRLGDIDGDGDLDLISADREENPNTYEYNQFIKYYENIGTAESPNFAANKVDPFGLSLDGYILFPELADIDNDGDLDFFAGGYYGNLDYQENTTIISVEEAIAQLEVNLFPNPASAELHIKGLEQKATFQVLDAVGKQVLNGQYDGFKPISLSTLKPGVYMLSIDVDSQTVRKSFTKQ